MSESSLRWLSELALIGIASIWGLTFVMVQDAIELLPSMAFLAYRFIRPRCSWPSSSDGSCAHFHAPAGSRAS